MFCEIVLAVGVSPAASGPGGDWLAGPVASPQLVCKLLRQFSEVDLTCQGLKGPVFSIPCQVEAFKWCFIHTSLKPGGCPQWLFSFSGERTPRAVFADSLHKPQGWSAPWQVLGCGPWRMWTSAVGVSLPARGQRHVAGVGGVAGPLSAIPFSYLQNRGKWYLNSEDGARSPGRVLSGWSAHTDSSYFIL